MKNQLAKTIDLYTKILTKAWEASWHHKYLWIFGFLASLIYSGSVLQNTFTHFFQIEPADQISTADLANQANYHFYFPELIQDYIKTLLIADTQQLILLTIAAVLFVLLIVLFSVRAQHILVSKINIKQRRKKVKVFELFYKDLKYMHFWRIFSLDILGKLSLIIIGLLATFPLAYLLTQDQLSNFFVYLPIYLIVLPLLFTVNALIIFSIINVIRKDESVFRALRSAFRLFKKNWLTTLEMAIILFIINLLAWTVFAIVLILAIALITFIHLGASNIDSIILSYITTFGALIIGGLLFIFFNGAITTYNYSAWMYFTDRIDRYSLFPILEKWTRRRSTR